MAGMSGCRNGLRQQHPRCPVHPDARLCYGKLLHELRRRRIRCKHRTEAGRHCENRRLRRSGLHRRAVRCDRYLLGYVRSLRTDFPVVIPHRRRRYLSDCLRNRRRRLLRRQHRSDLRYDHRILRYPGRTGYRQNQTPGCLVSFLLNPGSNRVLRCSFCHGSARYR